MGLGLGCSRLPYPGCRWAPCLCGGRPLLANGAALPAGPRGLSSLAHCMEAPRVGSQHPLPLLPALLSLWGHKVAIGYIHTQQKEQGLSLPRTGMPSRGPGLRQLSTPTKWPRDQQGPDRHWQETTHTQPRWTLAGSAPYLDRVYLTQWGPTPRPPPAYRSGIQKHGRDPKPNKRAQIKVDGVVCWYRALPSGHTLPGTRQGAGNWPRSCQG